MWTGIGLRGLRRISLGRGLLGMANQMQARQVAIHRAALTYGHAYASALLGTALDGSDQAVLRGWSPRRCLALYEDSVSDDWARYALVFVAGR